MKHLNFILLIIPFFLFSQEIIGIDSTSGAVITEKIDTVYVKDLVKNPMRASLYSAVLPGLGQVYNEKYWKVPIVWGLIGTGVGVTVYYNNSYKKYRSAYIAELNGDSHEYSGILDKERLAIAQDSQRRNRDWSIALTVVAYILNVLDATVDAHLYEIRRDRDLSVDPTAFIDPVTKETHMGLAIKINLK